MSSFLVPDLSLEDLVLPEETLWFFRRRFRLDLFNMVSEQFFRLQDQGFIAKGTLATRIRRRNVSLITRWLRAPGNWGLDTVSDLMVGMGLDPRVLLRQADHIASVPEVSLRSQQPETGDEFAAVLGCPPHPTYIDRRWEIVIKVGEPQNRTDVIQGEAVKPGAFLRAAAALAS